MNITVYLGSAFGNDPLYADAVKEMGEWIADQGHCLVYGGANCGLMGLLAESVKKHQGKVIGVMPQFFVDRGLVYEKMDELIITEDMSERKKKMIELGEAFIAFPGGSGTLEEISEVMCKVSLQHLSAPCIVYDVNDYYADLKRQIQKMIACGFATEDRVKNVYFVQSLSQIVSILTDRSQG